MNSSYHREWCYEVKTDAVNQSNINAQKLSQLQIPLPPIAEQKRIVVEIDRWLALIDKVEQGKEDLSAVVKQIKSKILDLAIHGKLVPQNPSDEPASELLRRINPSAQPCDKGPYGKMPDNWGLVTMQTVCDLTDGEKVSGREMLNLDVKYLRGEREGKTMTSGKFVAAGNFMILVDGENSGEVFRAPIDGYQGSTFKQLIINENMNANYVLHVINLHRKALKENKVGSAIPHLNKKLFRSIQVPIPPYNEQCRIVDAIHTAFRTLDKISESL